MSIRERTVHRAPNGRIVLNQITTYTQTGQFVRHVTSTAGYGQNAARIVRAAKAVSAKSIAKSDMLFSPEIYRQRGALVVIVPLNAGLHFLIGLHGANQRTIDTVGREIGA